MAASTIEDKIGMYEKVRDFALTNTAVFTTFTALTDKFTQHNTDLNTALDLLGESQLDVTGYTQEKAAKRSQVMELAFPLGQAITARSKSEGNLGLAEKYDLSVSSLNTLRDNDLYAYVKRMLTDTPEGMNLWNFSTTQQNALEDFLEQYFALIQKPRAEINERSVAGEELVDLVADMDENLKHMDNMMATYSITNSTLFLTWQGARAIDDSGTNTPADYEGNVTGPTPTLLITVTYLSSRTWRVKNTGSSELAFGLSTNPATIEFVQTVGAGQERILQSANIGGIGEHFLVMSADGIATTGYKVWITE